MVDFRCKIVFTLIFGLIVAFVVPVLAVDYLPGVSVGQYVKYGNFVVVPSSPVPFGWMKLEVITVSGKEITLLSSGQFENGTAIPTNGSKSTYNIETGRMNGEADYTYGPIIAGQLNESDLVPPLSYGFKVNKTESRTYLGVNRAVNIIETTYSDANYENHWTLVYDKISGIMLESGFELTQKLPTSTTTEVSYSVTETNIFSSTEPTSFNLPTEAFIGIVVVAVALVIAVVAQVLRKRRRGGRGDIEQAHA